MKLEKISDNIYILENNCNQIILNKEELKELSKDIVGLLSIN